MRMARSLPKKVQQSQQRHHEDDDSQDESDPGLLPSPTEVAVPLEHDRVRDIRHLLLSASKEIQTRGLS